jgi:hypothetical protein
VAAEGELQAAEKLAQAAAVINSQPGAMQLRQLQTMVEVSAEKNSTLIFPIPMELLGGMREAFNAMGGQHHEALIAHSDDVETIAVKELEPHEAEA